MRTFGERIVYNDPELRVAEVDVGLPDGERVWRHVARLHKAASGILRPRCQRSVTAPGRGVFVK